MSGVDPRSFWYIDEIVMAFYDDLRHVVYRVMMQRERPSLIGLFSVKEVTSSAKQHIGYFVPLMAVYEPEPYHGPFIWPFQLSDDLFDALSLLLVLGSQLCDLAFQFILLGNQIAHSIMVRAWRSRHTGEVLSTYLVHFVQQPLQPLGLVFNFPIL